LLATEELSILLGLFLFSLAGAEESRLFVPLAWSRAADELPPPPRGGSIPCLVILDLDLNSLQMGFLRLLFQLLHVLNEPFVVLEFNLVVLNRDLTLRLKETLGELEVGLLNLLDLSLPHKKVEALGSEGAQTCRV
jgi:hypothetical protein